LTDVSRNKISLGLLGGSFDPIHNGHLYLAEQARDALNLNRIILVPAFIPPHKTDRALSDPAQRLEMIRLAIAGRDWLEVDEREIQRGGISYTVDTVRALAGASPEAELYFLIGSDSLRELGTWRAIHEIARIVTFVTVPRDDRKIPSIDPLLKEKLKGTPLETISLDVPPLEISSSRIRDAVCRGNPILDLVPAAVAEYIERNGLYSS
jgi:nicotinate-nucleotide adenylyltransferase